MRRIYSIRFYRCFETEINRVDKFFVQDSTFVGGGNEIGRALIITKSIVSAERSLIESFNGLDEGGAIYLSKSSAHMKNLQIVVEHSIQYTVKISLLRTATSPSIHQSAK